MLCRLALRRVATILGAVAMVTMASAQSVSIEADRGSGAEYQVGDAIVVAYSVSVDATVEVFEVSPSGDHALVDRRQASAGERYSLRGVLEPPLGVVVFEVRATTASGRTLSASTFIRITPGDEAWEGLSRLDLSRARLISRDVFFELPAGHVVYSMMASPRGGLIVHSGIDRHQSGCPDREQYVGSNAVRYVGPDASPAVILRNVAGAFVSQSAPNSVFYIEGRSTGIMELDLVTGVSRKLSDFDDYDVYSTECRPLRIHALDLSDGTVGLTVYPPSNSRWTKIHRFTPDAFGREEILALVPSFAGAGSRIPDGSWLGSSNPRAINLAWFLEETTAHAWVMFCDWRDCVRVDLKADWVDWFQNRVRPWVSHPALAGGVRALAAAPRGQAHLMVDGDARLWIGRIWSDERSNIAQIAPGQSWDSIYNVAWDQRQDVIYWADGNRIYMGAVSAPYKP